jgi:hypothetical protein
VEAIGGKELPFVAVRTALLARGHSPLQLSEHKKQPKPAEKPPIVIEMQL